MKGKLRRRRGNKKQKKGKRERERDREGGREREKEKERERERIAKIKRCFRNCCHKCGITPLSPYDTHVITYTCIFF